MSVSIPAPLLDTWLCIADLKSRKKETALEQLAHAVAGAGVARDAELLASTLLRRERLASSALGKGVAVPHARSLAVVEPRLVLARVPRGADWVAPDGAPVTLIAAALAPSDYAESPFYDLVTRAIAAVRLQRRRQRLLDAETPGAIATLLREVPA